MVERLGCEIRRPHSAGVRRIQGRKGNFFYTWYLGCPVARVQIPLSSQTEDAAYEAQQRGLGTVGYDPEVRVKFQVEAGLDAEVMNPTTMLAVMRNPDVPVLHACSEVFNDWLAEFVSPAASGSSAKSRQPVELSGMM